MGLARNLTRGPKFEAEAGRGSWGGAASPVKGLGERCKLPQRGSGHSPKRKCILDTLRAHKKRLVATMSLVPVSRYNLSEPLNSTGRRTLRFHETQVEKH